LPEKQHVSISESTEIGGEYTLNLMRADNEEYGEIHKFCRLSLPSRFLSNL
jgi:hypothetical protein